MKILITRATSVVSHNLKGKLNNEQVILGDYVELPAFMLQNGSMINLPNPVSETYTHQMLTLCLDNAVTRVYALGDDEYNTLNNAAQLFSEYGIEILNSIDAI
ncbi:MAG: hypothetical protein ABI367_08800 [Mucilaginibacter sp.]